MAQAKEGPDRAASTRSFSVASYNVLATAYIHPAWYPRTSAMVLNPACRIPAVVQHASSLATDVICLQEVEKDTFAALRARLGGLGYAGHYALRQGRSEGCATFYRQEVFESAGTEVVVYADGADSGDIALLVSLESADRVVGIANTHLMWERPDTPLGAERGCRKIEQLLAECESTANPCHAWIICGDLNVTPDSTVVAALERAGFWFAHRGLAEAYTCNVNGEAKTIDYLFYSGSLRAEPETPPRITDRTPLPSAAEPSDHLPILSRFYWKS